MLSWPGIVVQYPGKKRHEWFHFYETTNVLGLECAGKICIRMNFGFTFAPVRQPLTFGFFCSKKYPMFKQPLSPSAEYNSAWITHQRAHTEFSWMPTQRDNQIHDVCFFMSWVCRLNIPPSLKASHGRNATQHTTQQTQQKHHT